ncbi:MAG: DNA internalization-related competence protein ComEC/Rec2 [Bacteroides sp.]
MALCYCLGAAGVILDMIWIDAIAAILLFILWIIFLPKRLCRKWHIIILLFIILGASSAQYHLKPTELSDILNSSPDGVNAVVTGTVTKIRNKSLNRQITIHNCTVFADKRTDEQIKAENLLINADYKLESCHEGDVIQIKGKISSFQKAMNAGEFDSAGYYASMNVNARMTASGIHVVSACTNRLLTAIFDIKEKMRQSFSQIATDEDAGVVISMVLGDKTELDEGVNSLYQRSGIAHILAISGLHISLLGMTLYRLLRRSGLKFAESAVISSAVIFGYGVMTGNAVSAVRAFVMFAVNMGAQVLGRKYDMLSSASLAALLILFEMPLMLTNSGFLLSFGAVLAIVRVYPVFEGIFPEWKKTMTGFAAKSICSSIAVSGSVSLVTIPVLLCSFHEFSLWSVFLNLIVLPLMGIVMAGALIGGVLGMVWIPAGKFAIGIVHYILGLFNVLCEFTESMPFGRMIPGTPDRPRMIVYYTVLAIMVIMPSVVKSKKRRLAALAVLISVMSAAMFWNPVRKLQVNMLYVGQGDGIYVRLPGGTNMLFDGGSSDKKDIGRYTLAPCLKAGGVSVLDYVFISHTDKDHCNGVEYLLENQKESGIRIKNLVMPDIIDKDEEYYRLVELAKQNGVKVTKIAKGAVMTEGEGKVSEGLLSWISSLGGVVSGGKVSGGVLSGSSSLGGMVSEGSSSEATFRLECLAPEKNVKFSGKNASSAVFKMSYGSFDMLFMGDLEEDGEDMLIDGNCLSQCEVLKVAHHGSRNSTKQEFLQLVAPRIALISAGKDNSYGHPHAETLLRLKEVDSAVYRTDELGQIRIYCDKAGVVRCEQGTGE